MTNSEQFPHLDKETIEIFDKYDADLANGTLWIYEGHAISTDNPGQVWIKHVNAKFAGRMDLT